MTIVNHARPVLALVLLAGALALAAACNGGGDKTPVAGVSPSGGETPQVEVTPGATEAAGETPSAGGAESANVQMVSGPAFSPTRLVIAAGTHVEITAENTAGFHSFAVYESEEAAGGDDEPIVETEACDSPCSDSVTVNLEAGEYFFRCEIHPGLMTGTLVAE